MAQWNTNHDYQQYSAYDTFTQSFNQPLNQPFLSHENGVLPLDSTSSLPSGFGYAQNALPTEPRQAQIPPTGVYPSVGNGLFGYDQPIPNLYPEQGGPTLTTGRIAEAPSNEGSSTQTPESAGQNEPATNIPHNGGASLKRGMACAFCRRRKLKCSGEKPKCSSCIRFNQDCEYAPPAKLAKYKALETRISELSDYIRQNTVDTSSNPFGPSHPVGSTANPPLGREDPVQTTPAPTSQFPATAKMTQAGCLVPDMDAAPPILPIPPNPLEDTSFTHAPTLDFDPNKYISESYLVFAQSSHSQPIPSTDTQQATKPAFNMSLAQNFFPFDENTQVDYYTQFDEVRRQIKSQVQSAANTPPRTGTQLEGTAPLQQSFDNASFPAHTSRPPPLYEEGLFDFTSGLLSQTAETTPRSIHHQFTHNTPTDRSGTPTSSSDPHSRIRQIPRQGSTPKSTASNISSPDSAVVGPPLNSTVDPNSPNPFGRPLPSHAMMYGQQSITAAQKIHVSHIDPVEGITESLGEFLFTPDQGQEEQVNSSTGPNSAGEISKRRRAGTGDTVRPRSKSLIKVESDGMTDAAREVLLDCFLTHSRLFFEMSIPRFRYRMTLHDRRRPAPALLYAMYLWATRMRTSPNGSPMEQHFFTAACRALDVSSANADRLIDCMRTAMLLSAYSYTSGRYHEGWIFAGMAVRMVLSTGLHQIRSCVFSPDPPRQPWLRNKTYLLGPPEDATELAERISTFWCILAIERCGALVTGFPSGIADQDILTPFPRAFTDIASRSVTEHDDLTIRDLYRHAYFEQEVDPPYTKWIKATVILERASKLAFLDPDEDSEYGRAWSKYHLQIGPLNPNLPKPPAYLDQPKWRRPKDYAEVKLALDQLKEHMGVEGIFPVDRRRNAEIDGRPEPSITPHTIMLHHLFAAVHMFLHDINAENVENNDALVGARRAVALIRHAPPMPYQDIDSFCITVWSIIAKVMLKELRRVSLLGDTASIQTVGEDIDLFVNEMNRVGVIMHMARSQAKAISDWKKQAMKVDAVSATVNEDQARPRKAPSL